MSTAVLTGTPLFQVMRIVTVVGYHCCLLQPSVTSFSAEIQDQGSWVSSSLLARLATLILVIVKSYRSVARSSCASVTPFFRKHNSLNQDRISPAQRDRAL
ncbi:hypothetical protein HD806DRAFT_102919 [Xylariaceae sp. AK1471]|nr:hypothetical protein HD806DRAFT_102919 [Xylariaceae sp. AK1471]